MNTRPKRRMFLLDNKNKTYYWLIGNPDNPPLLLLSGFTGIHNDLFPLANLLKTRYFVILPDLPGWGESEKTAENLTISFYALYLKKLLESINLPALTVAGHCMGAALAIEFASLYPNSCKKLILISTPYFEGTLQHLIFLHLADMTNHSPRLLRRIFFFWRSRIFSMPLGLFLFLKYRSWKKKLYLVSRNFYEQPKQNEDVVEENWISLINFDYKKLSTLNLPIYLIHGSQDLIISINQITKLKDKYLPNSKLEFIQKAGHLPPMETPGSLTSLILKYPI